MNTQKKIIILMVIAIVLILGSNLISINKEAEIQINILNKEAIKTTLGDDTCLYEFKTIIRNDGVLIENSIFEIQMIKSGIPIEIDEFTIGDMGNLETRTILKNYTRDCNYLDSFNVTVK